MKQINEDCQNKLELSKFVSHVFTTYSSKKMKNETSLLFAHSCGPSFAWRSCLQFPSIIGTLLQLPLEEQILM